MEAARITGISRLSIAIILCVYLVGCERREPIPDVKYGEFPFSLIYIESDKKSVINDTIICKYDGSNYTENGIYNAWKKSYASGRSEIVIMGLGVNKHISFVDGGCDYYMGDLLPEVTMNLDSKNLELHYKVGSTQNISLIRHEQAKEEFGIEILEFNPSKPIIQ